jgi:hypothetical protein
MGILQGFYGDLLTGMGIYYRACVEHEFLNRFLQFGHRSCMQRE